MLSVVIPAYNEESNIVNTAATISKILSDASIENELIFVNDGSSDRTWEAINEASKIFDNLVGISFSRNFGKESAIFAGLSESKGECVAVIDCDLQHPPEELVNMYKLWQEGYEVIEGLKKSRGKESQTKGFMAKLFYKLISRSSKVDLERSSDFKLLDRKAVNELLLMPERNIFFRALSSWIGYNKTSIEYDVKDRYAGDSKWSKRELFKYAISDIAAFSAAPMQIVTVLGFCIFIVSVILGIIALVQKIGGYSSGGFTTVIILLGFIGSIIMISLGIIGYYIAKIYEEVKGRPRYIVSNRVNGKKQKEI